MAQLDLILFFLHVHTRLYDMATMIPIIRSLSESCLEILSQDQSDWLVEEVGSPLLHSLTCLGNFCPSDLIPSTNNTCLSSLFERYCCRTRELIDDSANSSQQ